MEENNNFDVNFDFAFNSIIQSYDFKTKFQYLQQSIDNDKDVLSEMHEGFKCQIGKNCKNNSSVEKIKEKLNELFESYNSFEQFLNNNLKIQIQNGDLYEAAKENEVDKIATILAIAKNKLAKKYNFYSVVNRLEAYKQTLIHNINNFWHHVKVDFLNNFLSKENENKKKQTRKFKGQ